MKLKSPMLWGVLLGFASCANQSEVFSIERFYPLDPGCVSGARAATAIVRNGLLDVAAGAPQFFIGVRISGADKIIQSPVVLGEKILELPNRDRPLVKQQVVTYRLSKRLGTAPKPYITNISLPFNAGTVQGPIQLISPDLGDLLTANLVEPAGPPPNGAIEDFVDILADVEFKGEYSSTRTPFSTGVLTFPIRAYKSLPEPCSTKPDGTPFGYVKFKESMALEPDLCAYIGQQASQLSLPPVPACCTAVGPMGGAGC